MQDRRHAPEYGRKTEGAFGTQPVDQWARNQLANAIGQQKAAGDQSIIGITDTKFTSQHGCYHTKYRPVDVVDSGDDRQKDGDAPAYGHGCPSFIVFGTLLLGSERLPDRPQHRRRQHHEYHAKHAVQQAAMLREIARPGRSG